MEHRYDPFRSEKYDFSEDNDSLHVKPLGEIHIVHDNERVSHPGKLANRHYHHHSAKKEPKDYFGTMKKAADETNKMLEKSGAPFQIKIYREGEDVIIDCIQIDESGHVVRETRKNITHEDFSVWIDDIVKAEGLFFDNRA
ncbi:MAG: hypothetical protein GF350_15190 [Chitinivibrionales bacterium]|nr:hypothetical protein [Chitinivibrionales bacterium]